MLKAVKVRLYPSSEQKQIISSQIGGARYVYNRALDLRKTAYTKFGIKVGKFALINHIAKLKNTSTLKHFNNQSQIWIKPISTSSKVAVIQSLNHDIVPAKAINTHEGLKLMATRYFCLKWDG